MAFESYGSGNSSEGKKKDIDYDGLNNYVVEAAGLQNPDVLVGVIAGIVDLGIQSQEDAEIPFVGSEQDELDEIAKNPDTYFKDGIDQQTKKPARFKCWKQRAIQSVAIAVDFPEIMLDKGQFLGDDSGTEKPLRMWLGGQFFNSVKKGMQIARPIPLKITKDSKNRWSFKNNHTLYKMATAAKIIAPDGVFLPQEIDKLIGKALQFEAQIYMKAGKDGKEYFTEKVAFKSGLGRGQVAPELPTDTFVVQFNGDNDPTALKEIRNHVANTIRNATNFEGSPIQKQLDAAKASYGNNATSDEAEEDEVPETKAPEVKKAPKTTGRAAKTTPVDEDADGSPF